ncbi:glycosyl hydrolase family 71-domain-containing protein [Pseudomassariella vexata]|uniref:Glycosyl hydrolase family 71-domain-containing protein n=1 Tax=Pseudomassariella vexata TaxID=1141098 RepID=A0A1Y2DW85_9PEZI|nr:glycosyl hydrolase family 71-domain-containing protein [Pseudomassariella vexata]ORY63528.1 glycosyl hydrolase family 71-domain-containing protein [Pseudomassariella vexata]
MIIASTAGIDAFSFDYAGNGAWTKADVISLLSTYARNGVYFQHDGSMPLVSTVEGPASAADWVEIKATSGCFFMPDWSSLGAKVAVELEGLEIDTYGDASYIQYLNGKPYMMAVSPWFYTNLPGYNKNWMWPEKEMLLWPRRWNQILFLQPDYVEIISWNDFGEASMDHSGLHYPLPVWANQYKNNVATVIDESLILMYQLHDVMSCNDGGTVVNTASQLQVEVLPEDSVIISRYIGFMATLGSSASVRITVGGTTMTSGWLREPAGGVGVYYGTLYLEDGITGDVTAELVRDDVKVIQMTGDAIGGCRDDGYANFNFNVVGSFSPQTVSADTANLDDLVCNAGTGAVDFAVICSKSCRYGYCPFGACVCTGMGEQTELPEATGVLGYAKSDTNYIGLCSFLYNYGFEFDKYCSTTENSLSTPSVSPFLPDYCTGGTATDDWTEYGADDLCAWLCSYGYCPIRICSCSSQGTLVPLDNIAVPSDIVLPDEDNMTLDNMCTFACNYGVCVCEVSDESSPACDWTLSFDTLLDLAAVSDSYTAYCNEIYALNDVNDGYDTLFGYYVKYVDNLIQPAIDTFMAHDGWTFFECAWGSGADATDPGDLACPDTSDIDRENQLLQNGMTVTWSFANETGFWAVLEETYGIEQAWVKMGSIEVATDCVPGSISCLGSVCVTTSPCIAKFLKYDNFPMKADDIVVPNPKDIFTEAGTGLGDLPDKIDATTFDIMLGQWNGSGLDPVQVVSMPVALAQQAVSAMQQVKDLGETEKEEDIYTIVEDPDSAPMAIMGMLVDAGGVALAARDAEGFATMASLRRGMGEGVEEQATLIQKITRSSDQ